MRKSLPRKRRILIVGEGRETEYNYFVGFRNHFKSELDKLATSISVQRGKGGDAKSIVENAIKEAKKFQAEAKYGDRVFLLMDTEGAGRAGELPNAEKLAKKNNIEIIYSSPAIEYWILCHFPKVKRSYFKDSNSVIRVLHNSWKQQFTAKYDKADEDIFQKLRDNFPMPASKP